MYRGGEASGEADRTRRAGAGGNNNQPRGDNVSGADGVLREYPSQGLAKFLSGCGMSEQRGVVFKGAGGGGGEDYGYIF